MNKYQKMINKITILEHEDMVKAGFNVLSFREMRIAVREAHKGDPLNKLKHYKEYWYGRR